MKRLKDILNPFLSIIFGALLLLYYLNLLQGTGKTLAIGIVATILAAYYLTIGILSVVLKGKLDMKIFNIINVVAYPLFLFVSRLLIVIDLAQYLGPNGWVISIITLVASLMLPVTYLVSSFVNADPLKRLCQLFGMIFVLALILDSLFTLNGDAIALGDLSLVGIVIYALFASMLMSSLNPSKEETKQEETKEEPQE